MRPVFSGGRRIRRTSLITPLPEVALRPQCQFNRVAGLIPVENKAALTTLRGFPFEAFRQMPKAVGYMQGSRLASQLTCELLP
jgi:hypothetical protein